VTGRYNPGADQLMWVLYLPKLAEENALKDKVTEIPPICI
jgi:hypothetical protein